MSNTPAMNSKKNNNKKVDIHIPDSTESAELIDRFPSSKTNTQRKVLLKPDSSNRAPTIDFGESQLESSQKLSAINL